MATSSKTLIDKPELAEELVELAAVCIRRLANDSLAKEEITALNYAVTGVYRLLPYITVPRVALGEASMFSLGVEQDSE